MFYTDLIDDAPVTMTARQLRLAIQEAHLEAREQALREAAELVAEFDTPRFAAQHLRSHANEQGKAREELAREIDATRGAVR